ncbi:peptidylprolyl isomerase [Caulobacter sp. S45]|uniref:peptidylprolyl isomerase n=1 Tax=Caulobacter sp. S45 TaxID=1641861 RepID=UPI0020B11019|nr:peptidylprolyl isomerase [Caulobacter sp. S45]
MSDPWSRRSLLAAAGVFVAGSAHGQPVDGRIKVEIRTQMGLIVLELRPDKAPITSANFLRYVDAKHFDGASFYRAAHPPGFPNVGLVEGGLQNDPARLFKPIAHESTLLTGLAHKDGTISMAREAEGTATADFFICCGDAPYLDAHPDTPGDNAGYAAFGQVLQGMDVVRAILAMPTSSEARNPVMRGQILAVPVPILQARRAA